MKKASSAKASNTRSALFECRARTTLCTPLVLWAPWLLLLTNHWAGRLERVKQRLKLRDGAQIYYGAATSLSVKPALSTALGDIRKRGSAGWNHDVHVPHLDSSAVAEVSDFIKPLALVLHEIHDLLQLTALLLCWLRLLLFQLS